MPAFVYSYGCRKPSFGCELIDAQISAAHKYYNRLIELNREHRQRRDETMRAICPDWDAVQQAVDQAVAEVERIVDEIRAANAKARRKVATKEDAARLKVAKAARKEAWEKRKVARAIVADHAATQVALGKLAIEYNGELVGDGPRRKGGQLKDARASCGVYWGTYLRVESAVEAAIKKSIGLPRFKSWNHGEGSVAVQVQLGATWPELLSGAGKVGGLIGRVSIRMRGKHRAPIATFWMRVGQEKADRIEIDVSWHRELPADAKIMGVALVRRPLAPHRMSDGKWHMRYEWSLQFTLRTNSVKERAKSGKCGIDVGWRLMEDGLRVAYVAGDDGGIEELRLPARLLSLREKGESLQAIRDRNWNAIIEKVADWKAAKGDSLPEWFREATKFMTHWRGKGKLIRVLDEWREKRIDGDEEIVAAVQAWREQDTHLWQWQSACERQFRDRRKALYRQFAAKIRKSYHTVVVEECDWSKLARKAAPTDNTVDLTKWYMRAASIGMLRTLLVNDGAIKSDAKDTTKKCHACGSIEEFDHVKELVHTCSQCSLPWDQDYNAAMNLLARAKVVDQTPGTARGAEEEAAVAVAASGSEYVGRFARRKLDRSRKEAEKAAG